MNRFFSLLKRLLCGSRQLPKDKLVERAVLSTSVILTTSPEVELFGLGEVDSSDIIRPDESNKKLSAKREDTNITLKDIHIWAYDWESISADKIKPIIENALNEVRAQIDATPVLNRCTIPVSNRKDVNIDVYFKNCNMQYPFMEYPSIRYIFVSTEHHLPQELIDVVRSAIRSAKNEIEQVDGVSYFFDIEVVIKRIVPDGIWKDDWPWPF
ncbi:MAG: hypothetical protein WAV73_02460 [Candidatus Moraniibacteriota bacterium]